MTQPSNHAKTFAVDHMTCDSELDGLTGHQIYDRIIEDKDWFENFVVVWEPFDGTDYDSFVDQLEIFASQVQEFIDLVFRGAAQWKS